MRRIVKTIISKCNNKIEPCRVDSTKLILSNVINKIRIVEPDLEKALDAFYEAFPYTNETVIINQENAANFV